MYDKHDRGLAIYMYVVFIGLLENFHIFLSHEKNINSAIVSLGIYQIPTCTYMLSDFKGYIIMYSVPMNNDK